MDCKSIDHLVIIAGPPAAGKTTLIAGLRQGRHPEILRALGLRAGASTAAALDHCLAGVPQARFDVRKEREILIIHHDLLWSAYVHRAPAGGDAGAGAIIPHARRLSCITLWSPPRILADRTIDFRLRRPLFDNPVERAKAQLFRIVPRNSIIRIARYPWVYSPLCCLSRLPHGGLGWWSRQSGLAYHLNLLTACALPGRITHVYRQWFQFCERAIIQAGTHTIAKSDGGLTLLPHETWPELTGDIRNAGESACSHSG